MYRRRDERWRHDRDRYRDRPESAEQRAYSAGFTRGLHERAIEPLPHNYGERHYPPDYDRDRRRRR